MKVGLPVRILSLVVTAAMCLPAATTAAVLYDDDFESWAVGTYPAPPWVVMFSGESAAVSDLVAHGGSHSFRSESRSGWSRCDYVPMASIPDLVEYRASVRVDAPGYGCGLGFPYVDPTAANTFWAGNAVLFNDDGRIRFYSRSIGAVDLAPWAAGIWYEVVVQIDYTSLRAQVSIDGVSVGQDLVTEPKVLTYYPVSVPLDKFGFFGWSTANQSGVHYLDDVRLLSDDDVPVRPWTWGAIKGLYR